MAANIAGGRLFVVVGPTGVGKDTLLKKLKDAYPDQFVKAISTTTRDPRPQERNGVDYHFLTKDEFEGKIANKEFLEHATVHGNYYGTSVVSVDKVLSEGKDVIKDLDVQGCVMLKTNESLRGRMTAVFIVPPGLTVDDKLNVLADRVRGRNSGETEEAIATRLETARNELAALEDERRPVFDHVIENANLDTAYGELRRAIIGEESVPVAN